MIRQIILLRGVNVGASRRLPMAGLKAAMRAEGFSDCETVIASGNLVMSAGEDAAMIEAAVEQVIERAFNLRVEAIARTGDAIAAIAKTNPFPDAQPKLLHLGLSKHPMNAGAAASLSVRGTQGERVAALEDCLWIDYADSGVARSNLTPSVLDKAAGSTVTARNWNTICKLVALAKG